MEQKKIQRQNRAIWTKLVIAGLLILTAALDFTSFAIHPEYWDFDISPLVLFTNNIFLIALVKFGVIAGILYMLFKVRGNDYFKFLWIMCAFYLIIFQAIGTISNRQVAEQAPPPEAAPSTEVKVQASVNIAMFYAYYPILFSMLCFWIWNWGWRED